MTTPGFAAVGRIIKPSCLLLLTAAMLFLPSDVSAQRVQPAGITPDLRRSSELRVRVDREDNHPRCTPHHTWRDALKYAALGFAGITLMPFRSDNGPYFQRVRLLATAAGFVVGGVHGQLRDRRECPLNR